MKILHINTSDINGGAARAAFRLHRALLAQDVDSQMLVQAKDSGDKTVIGPVSKVGKGMGLLRPTLNQLPNMLYPRRTRTPFHATWLPFSGVVHKIQEINPDLVHLHWIAGGFVRIEHLVKIARPIVWSLHDMWALTGGCNIDWGCGKYLEACGACPVLGSNWFRDLSYWNFRRKQKHLAKIPHLKINGLSRWIADCAKNSTLFQDRKVVNLPNPINIEVYKPMPKGQAKQIFGFSPHKRQVLFGAINATNNDNKGFSELIQSLEYVQVENIELAVFGSSEPENAPKFPFQTHYLGKIQDDISLRILYSAADVIVVPSKQENLCNTIMEALACGTPVVGFAIGGNGDMIDHQVNGYLAEPFDSKDMASGIEYCLDQTIALKLQKNAREKIVRNFDSQLVAQQYIDLYKTELSGI